MKSNEKIASDSTASVNGVLFKIFTEQSIQCNMHSFGEKSDGVGVAKTTLSSYSLSLDDIRKYVESFSNKLATVADEIRTLKQNSTVGSSNTSNGHHVNEVDTVYEGNAKSLLEDFLQTDILVTSSGIVNRFIVEFPPNATFFILHFRFAFSLIYLTFNVDIPLSFESLMQALANSFTSSFNSELNGDTRDADGFISDFIERLRGYFSYSNGVLRRYNLLTAYFYHVE